ncbi:hypothetical protein ABZ820_13630 [Streptomyces diacarni]|uniref:hypothetical protein n=1 Tax=Streptomyces diacarni TaxID=2800381 RepID=UPI0033D6E83D
MAGQRAAGQRGGEARRPGRREAADRNGHVDGHRDERGAERETRTLRHLLPREVQAVPGAPHWKPRTGRSVLAGGVREQRNGLAGVHAAVWEGPAVAALQPVNREPALACRETDALPTLPDVELGTRTRGPAPA